MDWIIIQCLRVNKRQYISDGTSGPAGHVWRAPSVIVGARSSTGQLKTDHGTHLPRNTLNSVRMVPRCCSDETPLTTYKYAVRGRSWNESARDCRYGSAGGHADRSRNNELSDSVADSYPATEGRLFKRQTRRHLTFWSPATKPRGRAERAKTSNVAIKSGGRIRSCCR